MLHFAERIYVAGHTGMVGSAIVRQLIRLGHPRSHIITRTRAELDLSNQAAVLAFFAQEKPDHVYLAAAQAGGAHAHQAQPARFVFLVSDEAKQRLAPHMAAGNQDKTLAAPVNVLIAFDLNFGEKIPQVFPHRPQLREVFAANPAPTGMGVLR